MKKIVATQALLLALARSGPAAAACDPSQALEIDISNMAFTPAEATVCVGQTVRWTNNEPAGTRRPIRHTVTFDATLAAVPSNVALPAGAEPIHSGFLLPGASFEHTFTVPGDYKYICVPHEEMGHVATLRVVE